MRFVAFPIFLPSAVGDINDIKSNIIGADSVKLDEIPLLAGHAAVIGWYENMAKALNAPRRDNEYIRQLYQAALAVPIRIRLDPTIETAQLDSLQYSEMLRQSSTAS